MGRPSSVQMDNHEDMRLQHLRERLVEKEAILTRMAEKAVASPDYTTRLRGKASGVRLALSFVDEYLREKDRVW